MDRSEFKCIRAYHGSLDSLKNDGYSVVNESRCSFLLYARLRHIRNNRCLALTAHLHPRNSSLVLEELKDYCRPTELEFTSFV